MIVCLEQDRFGRREKGVGPILKGGVPVGRNPPLYQLFTNPPNEVGSCGSNE